MIIDSAGEEVSLSSLFIHYDGNHCQYLIDKPKVVFVDACRGSMKSPTILRVKDVNDEKDFANKNTEDESESKMIKLKPKTTQTSNTVHNVKDKAKPSPLEATNKNSTVVDNWYHSQANFIHIYANPEGYAAADAGMKGGYLIGAIKRVFSNLEISLNQTLDDMIRQIRAETKNNAGRGTLECVEVIDKMTYKVRFEKRKARKQKQNVQSV